MPTCVVVVVACGAIDCGLRIKSKYSFFYIYNIIRISLGLANVSVARFCLAKDVARSDWSSSWRRLRHPACQSGGGQCAACKEGIVRAIACRPNRQQQLQSANTHYHTQTHTLSNTHTHKYKIHTHTQCARTSFFCCCANRRMRDLFISCACEHNNKKLVLCACVYVCVLECPCVCVSVCANVCQVHCAALSPLGDLQPLSCFGWSGPRQVAAAVACNWPTRLL